MRFFAIIVILALAACAGDAPVQSDFDPTVDFARYDSFRIVESPILIPPEGSALASAPIRTIFESIRDELRHRPMAELAEGAGLSVTVTIHVGEETAVDRWGYRWDAEGDPVDGATYDFREGTLVIDFFDAATEQLVWRGWAHSAISRTEDYDLGYLDAVVRAILAQYPPAPDA